MLKVPEKIFNIDINDIEVGLSDIHIYGRITAIADVFDALAHERPYKKAWELDRILELFRNEKGKHFDPSLIDIFMKNLDEFLEIMNSLQDNH